MQLVQLILNSHISTLLYIFIIFKVLVVVVVVCLLGGLFCLGFVCLGCNEFSVNYD